MPWISTRRSTGGTLGGRSDLSSGEALTPSTCFPIPSRPYASLRVLSHEALKPSMQLRAHFGKSGSQTSSPLSSTVKSQVRAGFEGYVGDDVNRRRNIKTLFLCC
jgi:hypothetical protein